MRRFSDTIPVRPRGPVEITPTEADAAIRASWPPRSGAALRLVQPMAAEASTDVDETPASSEYDFSHGRRDRMAAAHFWRAVLAITLFLLAAAVWQLWPA